MPRTIFAALSAVVAAAAPPHIIMHLVDDWGWNNIGYRGNQEILTPNMDALAAEGVKLDRFYTHKFCSPSRSSLQSGRETRHVNVFNLDPPVYNLSDPVSGFSGIPRNMTTVAQKMAAGGYAAHMAGKWDCGMATPDHIPTGRGYNSSLGYHEHLNDYWTEAAQFQCGGSPGTPSQLTDLWDTRAPAYGLNNSALCSQTNQAAGCVYEDELLAGRVLDIIAAHDAGTPLFLFWAMHVVHGPLEVPQAYVNKFSNITDQPRRLYTAMVNFADDKVGAVVAALKSRGMWNNTLWVTSADNGGPISGGANNYPLRGGKFTNFEGGIRVNAFASGGALPAAVRGTTYAGLAAMPDLYATFAGLAGQDTSDPRAAAAGLPPVDGLNLWPALSGANLTSPRARFFIASNSNTTSQGEGPTALNQSVTIQGVFEPPYKLLIGPLTWPQWQGPTFPNSTGPQPSPDAIEHCADPDGTMFPMGHGCLFNVIDDPAELRNLAAEPAHAATVTRLRGLIAAEQATVFNPRRGTANQTLLCNAAYNPAGAGNGFGPYHGFLGPFLP